MIELKNVSKAYKKNNLILDDISMEISSGKITVLIGSSGCGKTTLLKMINKLNTITSGDIFIDGVSVSKSSATLLRRKIGYVVQEGGLFPHMTIEENIGIIMKIEGIDKEKRSGKVDELLQMVELEPAIFKNLYPSQVSGGQRQRVGVARAFSAEPEIILMDEPFSALDPVTRTELQDEVCRLQRKFNKTIIFVTHDMDEAIKIADKICILQDGHIAQYDTPENILKYPANSYVEHFVGKNRLWSNPVFIKASDIMSLNPYRISSDRNVIQAIQIMTHNRIDSILITDEGKLCGILRLNDLKHLSDYSSPVVKYMTTSYPYVYADTSLNKILNSIDYKKSGIIPVITHDRQIAGYLTKSNLLSTLSKQYSEDSVIFERSAAI